MELTIPLVAVLAITTIAVYTDTRRGLIPNLLTFPAMAFGLALNAYLGGWHGLGQAALGLVLGIAFYLIPFVLGGMGGGDVKLLAAIGAILGPGLVIRVFIFAALFGGMIALTLIVRQMGWSAAYAVRDGSWRTFLKPSRGDSFFGSFPYAAAMWFGVVAAYTVR
jgi:prepilin peptidase CpaA